MVLLVVSFAAFADEGMSMPRGERLLRTDITGYAETHTPPEKLSQHQVGWRSAVSAAGLAGQRLA